MNEMGWSRKDGPTASTVSDPRSALKAVDAGKTAQICGSIIPHTACGQNRKPHPGRMAQHLVRAGADAISVISEFENCMKQGDCRIVPADQAGTAARRAGAK